MKIDIEAAMDWAKAEKESAKAIADRLISAGCVDKSNTFTRIIVAHPLELSIIVSATGIPEPTAVVRVSFRDMYELCGAEGRSVADAVKWCMSRPFGVVTVGAVFGWEAEA